MAYAIVAERQQRASSLAHEIPAANGDALPIEDSEPGLFRIGNAAAPPGEHANAAMLSGLWAAERASNHLRASAEVTARR